MSDLRFTDSTVFEAAGPVEDNGTNVVGVTCPPSYTAPDLGSVHVPPAAFQRFVGEASRLFATAADGPRKGVRIRFVNLRLRKTGRFTKVFDADDWDFV